MEKIPFPRIHRVLRPLVKRIIPSGERMPPLVAWRSNVVVERFLYTLAEVGTGISALVCFPICNQLWNERFYPYYKATSLSDFMLFVSLSLVGEVFITLMQVAAANAMALLLQRLNRARFFSGSAIFP